MAIHQNHIQQLNQGVVLSPGQRVVKIGNYYFPVGVGGNYMPSKVESFVIYKCASVNVDNNTWSGYKAFRQDNRYYYEETLTENLIYLGNVVQVGSIYSSDGLIKIAELYNGVLNNGENIPRTLVAPTDASVNIEDKTLQLVDNTVNDNILNLN